MKINHVPFFDDEVIKQFVAGWVPWNVEFNILYLIVTEVRLIISHLDKTRATSLDGIKAKLLKLFVNIILPSLTVLLNCSIEIDTFLMKVAKVYPIHKNGDTNYSSNYRPSSVLHAVSKVREIGTLINIFHSF